MPSALASERSRDHLLDFPEISETFSACFSGPALRSAAGAVVVPGKFEMSVLLPGRDLTSQRAELYAAILALKLTHGSVTLASDCASVVDRATSLKQHGYCYEDREKF